MMLAARHPADVGRAMVIDMPPFLGIFFAGPGATSESVRPMADQTLAAMQASSGAEREKRISDTIATMIKTQSARAAYVKQGMDSDPGVAARAMAELIVTDLRPELKNITAPLTEVHVWTPQYPISAEQLTAGYQNMLKDAKDAKVVRIDDSYHFIMVDQPDRLNAAVDDFLK